jgi:hypothetical protein
LKEKLTPKYPNPFHPEVLRSHSLELTKAVTLEVIASPNRDVANISQIGYQLALGQDPEAVLRL